MKAFLQVVVVLIGLVIFTTATKLNFKDCGSKMGEITEVDGDPCPSQPCVVHKGTNVTMSVTFTTNSTATNATTVIHGIIAGIPAPFPSPCKDCGCNLQCPLAPGKTYKYVAALPVDKSYPSVQVVAKWELQDQNKNDIWCFEIPIIIE